MTLSEAELAELLSRHDETQPCEGLCREYRAARELEEARKVIAAARDMVAHVVMLTGNGEYDEQQFRRRDYLRNELAAYDRAVGGAK